MFLAISLQDSLWIILFIFFAVSIYVYNKKQIGNATVAVLITIFIMFLLFYQFPDLVWLFTFGILVYWFFGSELKNQIGKSFFKK
jgi:chromate transport protein ChrA